MSLFTKRNNALHPIDGTGEAELENFMEGDVINCTLSKGRSLPHHRFFFSVLNHTFENWPELTDFQPKTVNHLRAWLTVYAGWYDTTEFIVHNHEDAITVAKILKAVLKQDRLDGIYRWLKVSNGKIILATPKTIKFIKMNQNEFTRYSEDVFMVIEDMTGINIADMKQIFEETEVK